MLNHEFIWAASQGGDTVDLVLKLVSGVAGLVALAFTVYVVFLKRKWKKDEEHAKDKAEKERLAYEKMITALKTELEPKIQSTAQMVTSIMEQLARLEDTHSNRPGKNDLKTLKYSFDNDIDDLKRSIAELKRDFSEFQRSCSLRHDTMSSHGSLPDLKARVDELNRKVERLEDFRHNSADRYVLMVGYQQDVKLITDAISVLREDLRTVIDMVDKL